MRHIMVLNAKGGSGKTTVATNLASYLALQGRQVVLVDMDPQGSSLAWLDARGAGRPAIKGHAGFRTPVRPSRTTDMIIIDAPAAVHAKPLSDMVRRAETILVPVLPSPIDMRAAAEFLGELKSLSRVASKRARIALLGNRVREYTRIYWELDEFLRKQRVPFLTSLRDSQNYIRAAERGLGIFELPPAATAIDREQWDPILRWVRSKRSQP